MDWGRGRACASDHAARLRADHRGPADRIDRIAGRNDHVAGRPGIDLRVQRVRRAR